MKLDLSRLDSETRALLNRYGFDAIPFEAIAERLLGQGLDPGRNAIQERIELPPESAFFRLPDPASGSGARLAKLGQDAIDSGQVGAVVLNGGMATRFGGVAKGAATALAGRSFLDLKISQVRSAGGGRAPVILMNSFATDEATAAHLARIAPDCEVRSFTQLISLRLTPEGALFFDKDQNPSLYAPGHGDLPIALRRSGELDRFLSRGGKYLTVSNVDNLGAGLDPRVLGAHIDQGNPMTVEIVDTYPGDVGGFPALVGGRIIIVEAFRIPASFDKTSIPVFNTNSFVFDAQALKRDFALDWFAAVKTVEGRKAVQFERLVGQLTEFLDATWLRVPRSGPESRFVPIKEPADLARDQDTLKALLSAQGVI